MRQLVLKFALMSLCTSLFINCGGSGSTLSTSSNSDPTKGDTTSEVVGNNISELTFSESGASLSFDDLEESDSVVMMLYSFSNDSDSLNFQISSSQSTEYLNKELYLSELDTDEDLTTETFHEHLRLEEEELLAQEGSPSASSNSSLYLTQQYAVGDTKTFKVLDSFSSSSSYESVAATLMLENDNFQFYVDNRNIEDFNEDDLEDLAEQYNAILADERSFLGNESDVNGDGKFAVLFTQVVNGLGGSSGGMVTGFFYAIDLFSDNTYEVSNEMEVFYSFVPDPSGSYGSAISNSFAFTNIYPGVLAHEFQHMVNFNQHYFINDSSSERGWLNEGMSHLMEDIYSLNADGYMEETGLENPARVASFLKNIASTCVTCGTNLSQRGGSYLFIRYLYEQAELGNISNLSDGAALIESLVQTGLRGDENVSQALYGLSGTEDDFHDIFGIYGLALYLSDTGLTTDNRLQILGINLRAVQEDNRGTVLNGPAIQQPSSLPFVDNMSGNSINFIQLSAETINEVGGSLEFSVGTGDVELGGYLVH
jgi:hypothetical protein